MATGGEVADGEECLGEILEHERVPGVDGEAHLEGVAGDVGQSAASGERAEATPQARVGAVDLHRGGVAAQGEGVVLLEVGAGGGGAGGCVGPRLDAVGGADGDGFGRVGRLALLRGLRQETPEVLQGEKLHLGHGGGEGDAQGARSALAGGRGRDAPGGIEFHDEVVGGVAHHGVVQDAPELARSLPLSPVAHVQERGLVLARQPRLLRLARDARSRCRQTGVVIAMDGIVQCRPLHGARGKSRAPASAP